MGEEMKRARPMGRPKGGEIEEVRGALCDMEERARILNQPDWAGSGGSGLGQPVCYGAVEDHHNHTDRSAAAGQHGSSPRCHSFGSIFFCCCCFSFGRRRRLGHGARAGLGGTPTFVGRPPCALDGVLREEGEGGGFFSFGDFLFWDFPLWVFFTLARSLLCFLFGFLSRDAGNGGRSNMRHPDLYLLGVSLQYIISDSTRRLFVLYSSCPQSMATRILNLAMHFLVSHSGQCMYLTSDTPEPLMRVCVYSPACSS